ncbi:hypothetical protein NYP20_14000 [Pseudomonas sp. N3-W]|uniref:hypothetical protein n=1 Tax=Pseudomonas sp. N3-W TaxID=2975049 RepID=UPI00217CDC90|nr:hypothetical protein [Pseudomonas sp. N3-W]UWF52381.1 hypothetical protein NYP20_14000 [Pseudomonas sp. N3-W]
MSDLILSSERRLAAVEFQQLASVPAAVEWFANFGIRTDGFGSNTVIGKPITG